MTSDNGAEPEERLVEAGLLLDSYGRLLTDRQRLFMRLHFEQDLSFSEIAREFNISRQAVHDSVKHAIEALQGFELALGLVNRTYGVGVDAGGSGTDAQESTFPAVAEEVEAAATPDFRCVFDVLERLRRYVRAESGVLDATWIETELDHLIQLLRPGSGHTEMTPRAE